MAVPIALTGSDQAVYDKTAIYRGCTIRETGGTNPIVVQIFDNSVTGGTLLLTKRLAANGDYDVHLGGDDALRCAKGIFVEVTGSGTLEGSVFIG